MNKKVIITILLALVAMSGQAQTISKDWFKTDTITVKGRIEGYDAELFGFTSMECYFEDIFEKDETTLVLDIAEDGTFCKKFQASYPIRLSFLADYSKVDFDEIPFFAYPGETIDITVKKIAMPHSASSENEQGQYKCIYNNGSSRDVQRWLRTYQSNRSLTSSLRNTNINFTVTNKNAETVWKDLKHQLQTVSQREHYTPLEEQLALACMQVDFASAYMDYALFRDDSLDCHALFDETKYTTVLQRIDFDNPLMLVSDSYSNLLNRIQYAKPVRQVLDNDSVSANQQTIDYYSVLRQMLGAKGNTLMAQLCSYKVMQDNFKFWRNNRDLLLEHMKRHGATLSDTLWQKAFEKIPSVDERFNIFINHITHPYIHQKAEQFYNNQMAQTDIASPLPVTPMADLIRSLCAKYPGKILMIDFWGMSCGPCRGAIQLSKELRAEIAKRDDVKLIFIAGERTIEGSDEYKKYVSEWLADEETICVTKSDFVRLQELFQFNSIPHYETITPDCRRVREDLSIGGYHNFEYELERLKEKLK